jgi:hypothetical protein
MQGIIRLFASHNFRCTNITLSIFSMLLINVFDQGY